MGTLMTGDLYVPRGEHLESREKKITVSLGASHNNACRAIVPLIKPFVLRHFCYRCGLHKVPGRL